MQHFLTIQGLLLAYVIGLGGEKYVFLNSFKYFSSDLTNKTNENGRLNMTLKAMTNSEDENKEMVFDDRFERRMKREVVTNIHTDTNSTYLSLVEECLRVYQNKTNNTRIYKIVSIDHVSKQHVGGILTEINFRISSENNTETKRCFSQIWRYFADNFTEYVVQCHNDTGGTNMMQNIWKDKNPDNPKYRLMAQVSMDIFLNKSDIKILHKVTQVKQVRVSRPPHPVVEIVFAMTSEMKNQSRTCTSTIYDESYKKVVVTCVIGDLPLDNHEESQLAMKYKSLACYSLQRYSSKHPERKIETDCSVTAVDRALEQSVRGKIIDIDFQITEPDNLRGNMDCFAKVWLLLEAENNIIVNCESSKRFHTLERTHDNDQIDERYQTLALLALQKFFKEHAFESPYSVKVQRTNERDVEGTVTKLEYKICCGSDKKLIQCKSQLWEDLRSYNKNITSNECNFPVERLADLTRKSPKKFTNELVKLFF